MAAQTPPVARSTFVTVLAWIFIMLAGFATFISILQNIMIAFVFPMAQMQAAAAEQKAPWFAAWMIQHFQVFFLFFLVVSASCLAAAIGLLRRRNWARLLFIALMALGIAWNLGGLVLGAFFLSSFPFSQAIPAGHPEFANFQIMFKVMFAINVVIVVAFTCLFGWIIKRLASEGVRREFGALRPA